MLGTYETFTHHGETWTRYPAEADGAFILGCDLGQSQDPTAIIVLHHRRTPLETWTVDEKNHKTKQNSLSRDRRSQGCDVEGHERG